LAQPQRTVQRIEATGHQRTGIGRSGIKVRGMANGHSRDSEPSIENAKAQSGRPHTTMGACGMRPAELNRRMRKTACPVVWEGQRAQSRWFDPIQSQFHHSGGIITVTISSTRQPSTLGLTQCSNPNFLKNFKKISN
jgi:hypothetical protein